MVYSAFERTEWLDLLRDVVEAGEIRRRVAVNMECKTLPMRTARSALAVCAVGQ